MRPGPCRALRRGSCHANLNPLCELPGVERPAPYLDDDGNLRDPSGNLVDPASEDWWSEPWADDAAQLLGPEWLAGHNPRRNSRRTRRRRTDNRGFPESRRRASPRADAGTRAPGSQGVSVGFRTPRRSADRCRPRSVSGPYIEAGGGGTATSTLGPRSVANSLKHNSVTASWRRVERLAEPRERVLTGVPTLLVGLEVQGVGPTRRNNVEVACV